MSDNSRNIQTEREELNGYIKTTVNQSTAIFLAKVDLPLPGKPTIIKIRFEEKLVISFKINFNDISE